MAPFREPHLLPVAFPQSSARAILRHVLKSPFSKSGLDFCSFPWALDQTVHLLGRGLGFLLPVCENSYHPADSNKNNNWNADLRFHWSPLGLQAEGQDNQHWRVQDCLQFIPLNCPGTPNGYIAVVFLPNSRVCNRACRSCDCFCNPVQFLEFLESISWQSVYCLFNLPYKTRVISDFWCLPVFEILMLSSGSTKSEQMLMSYSDLSHIACLHFILVLYCYTNLVLWELTQFQTSESLSLMHYTYFLFFLNWVRCPFL